MGQLQRSFFVGLVVWTAAISQGFSQSEGWGNLKGTILVTGSTPPVETEIIDKDQPTCLADREAPLDDNLVVSGNGGLRDAFVMMYLKRGKPVPAVHPDYERTLQQPVVLDNKLCRFEPHALFVRTGQTLRLKNSDDVGHNCHITLFNNEANVNIPINEHVDVKLKQSEKVPGNVVCDIHRWMDAVLLVRDEPYVAISDADGRFEIANIPAGTWTFQFWHRRAGYLKQLQVPGMDTGRRGDIEVTINDGETLDLGQLTIKGSAFKAR